MQLNPMDKLMLTFLRIIVWGMGGFFGALIFLLLSLPFNSYKSNQLNACNGITSEQLKVECITKVK